MTVMSRNNGWLTVDPTTQSRKNAFEKKSKGDLHQSSKMAPGWMHTQAKRDDILMKTFMNRPAENKNLRCEKNRVILADRDEP